MSIKLKNLFHYDSGDEREVNEEEMIRILEKHWTRGKTAYLFRQEQIFVEMKLPYDYRVYALYKEEPFVWFEHSIDGFDLMIESGCLGGVWEYAEGDKLISIVKEWRSKWLLEKTSGNTGR